MAGVEQEAELSRRLEDAHEQQRAISGVLHAAARSTALQPVLDEVVEACERLCKADYGVLYLLEQGLHTRRHSTSTRTLPSTTDNIREGEIVVQLATAEPGSAIGGDPATVFDAVPIPGSPGDVDLYVKKSIFPEAFANDLPRKTAAVLAAVQRPVAFSALVTPSGAPAWETIPSWYFVGTLDRVLPPAAQRFMAERAGARTVEVRASHLPMVSRPGALTKLIVEAAETVD